MVRELLENGVHFGHQTNKWNPKMKKYIFGAKSGVYIIDLEKTEKALVEAVDFLKDLTKSGKKVLFVGTKKQAKQIVKEEAVRCGMFYVDERWLGGCLTNFETIRKSVKRLNYLQEMKGSEIYASLAKKEKVKIEREKQKLLKNLEGIRDMEVLPGAVIVIDAESEKIAVREANRMGIPVLALIDTNSDPDMVNYPIPGNDDAIRSIKYICSVLADAVDKGHNEYDRKGKVVRKKEKKEKKEEKEEKEGTGVEEKTEEQRSVPEEKEKTVSIEKELTEEPEEKKKRGRGKISGEENIEGDISLK